MPGDEGWKPGGMVGMHLSNARTHKFLASSGRSFGFKTCGMCRGFLWGSFCLKCVQCGTMIHKSCEAREQTEANICSHGTEAAQGRPTFRFRVIANGKEALVEVDPNKSQIVTHGSKMGVPPTVESCKQVAVEKPATNGTKLSIVSQRGKTDITCASRREREQLAAAVAFLAEKVHKPLSTSEVRVFVGTWNMGDAPPPELGGPEKLSDFLRPEEKNDVVCVAVQECEYPPRPPYRTCEEDWFKTVQAVLGRQYFVIDQLSLQKIRLIVLARVEHREHITHVRNATEATGIGGVYGNKGGVAIGFTLRETRMCFVGSHLAAHQEKWEARNSDHFEILNGCKGLGRKDFWFNNDFHHVFWTGDLNYRIDYARAKVVQMCYKGPNGWNFLYPYDQLQQQLQLENAFIEFNESQPVFQPTYRYARGENTYPDDSKQRIPSWCDRVLWKSLAHEQIVQEDYTSVQSVTTSDHRPVISVFRMLVRNQFVPQSILEPLTSPPKTAAEVFDHAPTARFMVTGLAGHDLDSADPNGSSDPYVVFVSPALAEEPQTKYKSRTLDPVWEDSEVPPLRVNFDEKEYLETEYIFFSVYDYDRTSQDDPLGQGHLSLKGLVDGRAHNFCVRTLGGGKAAGTLTGTIQYFAR